MSKIAVRVGLTGVAVGLIARLRPITGLAIAELRRRIGSADALADYTLFGNDHDEVATRLRVLVAALKSLGAPFSLYELDDNESLKDGDQARCEIDDVTLENILRAHSEEVERQRRLGGEGR